MPRGKKRQGGKGGQGSTEEAGVAEEGKEREPSKEAKTVGGGSRGQGRRGERNQQRSEYGFAWGKRKNPTSRSKQRTRAQDPQNRQNDRSPYLPPQIEGGGGLGRMDYMVPWKPI